MASSAPVVGLPPPEANAEARARRRAAAALPVIAALALLARIHWSRQPSLWFDESFFWKLSRFPFFEVLSRTAADNYPALYPLLLKVWCEVFGYSAAAMRSLSAVCGVATVFGAYLFCLAALRANGREAPAPRQRSTALLAAALVALSVFQIRWSWDVKMMTLGAMLSVLSSWALLRAMRLERMRAWLVYAALALAFLHTHYYALFSVFAQIAFAAITYLRSAHWCCSRAFRRASFRALLLATVLMVMGFSPWLPTFLRQHQRERAVALRRPVTLQRVMKMPFSLFVEPEPEDANTDDETAGVLFLLSEALLLAALARPTRGSVYVVLAATAPLACGVAVSLADTNVFEARYLAFAQPFWLVAAAMAVSYVPARAPRYALAATLIGCSLFAHWRFCRAADFDQRPGARAAARYIEQHRAPGDAVVVCSQTNYYPLLYHSGGARGIWLFDDEKNVRRHSWGSAIILPSELLSRADLDSLASPRVWIVDSERASWGPLRVPRASHWRMRAQRRFRGTWGFEGEYVVTEFDNNAQPAGEVGRFTSAATVPGEPR